jgi:hypothetical protein
VGVHQIEDSVKVQKQILEQNTEEDRRLMLFKASTSPNVRHKR